MIWRGLSFCDTVRSEFSWGAELSSHKGVSEFFGVYVL